jgi:membrane-associated phospholipid phosphatase
MNFFFLTSIIILSIFVLLALSVSPRINESSSLVAKDYSLFLTVNNSHYGLVLNELMIWMTLYGREIVWIIVIVMFFIFGGWLGKKIAVTISLSILVLTFLVPVIKNLVERPRPLVPQVDFLLAADKEYAFPSGHATIVAAGLAVVLALYRGSARRTSYSNHSNNCDIHDYETMLKNEATKLYNKVAKGLVDEIVSKYDTRTLWSSLPLLSPLD